MQILNINTSEETTNKAHKKPSILEYEDMYICI